LHPVSALTQIAERITARGSEQRIPAMARDREFNRLVTVFNEMMDRLEKSFQQATRFSADASHELKTPLARLQAELEQALEGAASGSEQQEMYSSLLEEISRLKAIVQKLLFLAVADAGQLKLMRERVNLTRMVENLVEDCRAQAPGLSVEASLAPDLEVEADPDLLEQALQNLATNAVKFNCPNGRIGFEVLKESNRAVVRIANTGPGIPAAERGRLFQRFYRGDGSRSGRSEGVGLGLSLAREVVRAHGGEVLLEESRGTSTSFCLSLSLNSSEPNKLR
jgi:two-component system, OmpR family, heavy metal sensor histidine kinase CusS